MPDWIRPLIAVSLTSCGVGLFTALAGSLTAVAMGPDVGPGLHDVQETLHQVTLLMQVEIHPLSLTLASPTRHLIEQVLINQLQHRSSHRQERDISNGW